MSITAISRDFGSRPCVVRLSTTHDLATITSPGYLKKKEQLDALSLINYGGFEWVMGDVVSVDYDGGEGMFTLDVATGTLTAVGGGGGGGGVQSVTGVANQVSVNNANPNAPVVGLPPAMNVPGTFSVQGTTAINAIIDDDTMATATATNVPTAESVKAYVDQRVYQGDWLPDPFFQTPGTSTWSMARVGGRWWRQNNLVTVNGYYRGNVTVGDGSGLFIMGGLPFPYHYANSNPNWNGRTVQAFNWDISSMPIDFKDFSMFVMCLEWASELKIKKLKTGLAEDVTAADFSDGIIDISFSLTYRTEL